jgi:hypothetical protein
MSLILLCLLMVKPPWLQLIACSALNALPQMQWLGRCFGLQPYLRHRASRNSPLFRANPCSSMGLTDNQVDAPFSFASVTDLCWGMVNFAVTSSWFFMSSAVVLVVVVWRYYILWLLLLLKNECIIELSSIQLQQRDELFKDISNHVIIGPRLL